MKKWMMPLIIILLIAVGAIIGYVWVKAQIKEPVNKGTKTTQIKEVQKPTTKEESLQLSSSAFEEGSSIPAKYTCSGENVSPPFTISNVSTDTKSIALVMDDPDAAKEPAGNGQTFDHWILFNISPDTAEIAENSLPSGAMQGTNNFGRISYGGPCPPTLVHTYVFKLYALDIELKLNEGASKTEVETAMDGRIIEQAELTALYSQ